MADDLKIEQLLPCPFCGGQPTAYEGKHCSSVKCDNGHAIHEYKPTLAQAIAAWNKRSPVAGNSRDDVREATDELLIIRMAKAIHSESGSDFAFGDIPEADEAYTRYAMAAWSVAAQEMIAGAQALAALTTPATPTPEAPPASTVDDGLREELAALPVRTEILNVDTDERGRQEVRVSIDLRDRILAALSTEADSRGLLREAREALKQARDRLFLVEDFRAGDRNTVPQCEAALELAERRISDIDAHLTTEQEKPDAG